MYKKLFLITSLLLTLALISCKSKEEKANELIKNELSKTLYDFESYEPIETIVSEAYQTPNNDSSCVEMATFMTYQLSKVNEYIDAAKEAKDRAEIWGPPTAYSSLYSNNQFRKYMNEIDENMEKCRSGLALINAVGVAMQDSISKMNPSEVIGWEVKHRFRCKTRGGLSTIGNYRYIISKDFKDIILDQDIDDDDYKTICEMITDAQEGKYKLEETDENS